MILYAILCVEALASVVVCMSLKLEHGNDIEKRLDSSSGRSSILFGPQRTQNAMIWGNAYPPILLLLIVVSHDITSLLSFFQTCDGEAKIFRRDLSMTNREEAAGTDLLKFDVWPE